jgi:uncharacterized protein YprB with RNaseH-like and TPR domain
MLSLSEKLKSLGVQVGAQNLPKPPARLPEAYPIEAVVQGRFLPTPHGQVFVVETTYTPHYRHGQVGLQVESSRQAIAAWAEAAHLAHCSLEGLVFLDTETSGLAGGTGTYAFMVGLGRFEGNHFRVTQIFMRDPTEEKAQLAALVHFLSPCEALVTFNGKSFDVPLLQTRYTLHRHEPTLSTLTNLDLLPLARRLWRDRLPSRRLGELEYHILGASRTEEDVPGWLIPSLYFDYLRSGDARPLKNIFYHNMMDVLAMAALLNRMAGMLADPFQAVEHALDLVAVGKLYEALGQFDLAIALFTEGMERHDLPEDHYWETQRRLSLLQKRLNNLPAAVEIWQLAAAGRQIYAYIELAKYYEHTERDCTQALHWTQAALSLLHSRASRAEQREWLGDLKRRLSRLQQKVKKKENTP